MNRTSSRKNRKKRKAFDVATCGRVKVPIYRRRTPQGNFAFMVANYSNGKRRFDCYAEEADALEAANRLAKQLSQRDVLTASMTREQAIEYATAKQTLDPMNLSLVAAVTTLAEVVKLVGDLPNALAAAKFYVARHKRTMAKRVGDIVAELLTVKESRGASPRYTQDLRSRLGRFAEAFRKDACNVTTAEVQAWLDNQKLAAQSYANYRRVIYLLFEFAVARSYAADNPILGVERVKVRSGDVDFHS